jgi:hypothetical protein
MRPDRGRSFKACRIVDRRFVGEGYDYAYTRNRHKPPCSSIALGFHCHLSIKYRDLLAKRLPGGQKRFDDRGQGQVPVGRFPHARCERAFAAALNDMAESFQQSSNVVRNGLPLRDHLRPGGEQKLQGPGVHALDGDLAEPAGAHHLSESESIVGIGLIDLKAERLARRIPKASRQRRDWS